MTEFKKLFKKEELHLPWKIYVLGAIASFNKRKVSQSELRKRIKREKSLLCRNLSELEEEGLIVRSGQSGKKSFVSLTHRGIRTLLKLNEFFFFPSFNGKKGE